VNGVAGLGCDAPEYHAITVIDAGHQWPPTPGEPVHVGPEVLVLMSAPCADRAQAWLNAGADMVVSDAVAPRELEARVRALLRPRRQGSTPAAIRLDLSPPGLRWHDGRQLALAPREAQLLQVLALRQGRPGTKMELLLDLGWRQEGRTPPFLELVVSRLRARLRAELGEDAAQSLETRRGAGYAWRPSHLLEQG
jgi:DNA-binding response OmpR family regulator